MKELNSMVLPDDYSPCEKCGYDHDFDFNDALNAHAVMERDEMLKHLTMLVTGGGYEVIRDVKHHKGQDYGDVFVRHPKTGHAFKISVERAAEEDE